MRIANVIEEAKLGGPQIRMVRVARALTDSVDTLVIMPHVNSEPFRKTCDAYGISYRVVRLTRITKEWNAAFAYVLFSPIEVLLLARLFRRERIDLVHASGGSWQVKAVIAARIAGVPSVWHLNDTYTPNWVRRLFRLVQPLTQGFIFTSLSVEEYYGRDITGDRPVAFVPPPVDLSMYDPSVTHSGEAETLSLFGDAPVIGMIGNVNPIKGIETLIRAAAHLRTLGHAPHVVIVGAVFDRQVGYHRRLLALADELGLDRVHFVGARTDVLPLLARFDVYVCSSVSESWGAALWEAMAMARPVVSTNVGDISHHLVEGESGFVVPVGDADAMAKRISQLLDAPLMRKEIGARAREVARGFSPDKVADLTLDIYKRVLAGHRLSKKSV